MHSLSHTLTIFIHTQKHTGAILFIAAMVNLVKVVIICTSFSTEPIVETTPEERARLLSQAHAGDPESG
jgi:hypothetical protein